MSDGTDTLGVFTGLSWAAGRAT